MREGIMYEAFEGMNPTQADMLRAVRQRMAIVQSEIAELTREHDELQSQQRAILYGGSPE